MCSSVCSLSFLIEVGNWQTRKNCRRWFCHFFIRVCALKFGCSRALVVVSSGVFDEVAHVFPEHSYSDWQRQLYSAGRP